MSECILKTVSNPCVNEWEEPKDKEEKNKSICFSLTQVHHQSLSTALCACSVVVHMSLFDQIAEIAVQNFELKIAPFVVP